MFVPFRCKVNVGSYSWPIEKFSKQKIVDSRLRSPEFTLRLVHGSYLQDLKFHLFLTLTQHSEGGGKDGARRPTVATRWLKLSLWQVAKQYPDRDEYLTIKPDQRNQCIAWISLSGSQKERLCKLTGGYVGHNDLGFFFCNPKFVLYDDLLDKGKDFLCRDRLFIECEMYALINDARYVDSWLFDPSTPAAVHHDVMEHSLTSDLKEMLSTGENSDVVLVASDGKEFRAHAAILSSRSPVFAAMFKHSMKEKREKRVEINDLPPEHVEGLLNFIYTDTVPEITSVAADLFVAAHKYNIPKLILLCEEAMVSNLKVENAAEFLMFADLHDAGLLRLAAKRFTVTHLKEVRETEGWKKLISHNPHFSDEITDELVDFMAKITLP